jgi:prepilin-type N-terminal cleavage/methylation domain-containing protein
MAVADRRPGPAGPPGSAGGFTLIELMIVIAIIAVLASIAIPNLMAAKLSANEAGAIATLRNLGSAQAMVQGAGRIDVDNDAIGEYGTFMELTGRVKVRKAKFNSTPPGCDFSQFGTEIRPAILSQSLGNVDSVGFVSKAGYLYMILLPDTSDPAKWVHEENTGTTELPVADLSNSGQTGGGTDFIGIDMAETTWCCYAVPSVRGNSGNRVFFTCQTGDILQSGNDVAKHSGGATAIDGRSAYLTDNITAKIAVGTEGRDRDVWKITN